MSYALGASFTASSLLGPRAFPKARTPERTGSPRAACNFSDIDILDPAKLVATDANLYHHTWLLGGSPAAAAKSAGEAPAADDVLISTLSGRQTVPQFAGADATVRSFLRLYNGEGVRWLAKLLAGAAISKADAEDILSDILEDALVGVMITLGHDQKVVRLPRGDNSLVIAVSERLPGVPDEDASRLSHQLVEDLWRRLQDNSALVIDGGAAVLDEAGSLCLIDRTMEAIAKSRAT